ncbi:hypothetical protein EV424DRAFT_6053 [Suillus variegatus]|nr:hypothetical protein EV424DRAFT_6053 [Suillus variegatus]
MDSLRAHHRNRHEFTLKPSRSTLQDLSSSWPEQAPDQRRPLLQSCLQLLEGLERRVPEEIQEIQEIRSLIMDILNNNQSDVTSENSGVCDSTVDSQGGLDSLNAIPPFVSSHDRYLVSQPASHETFGVTGSLLEGTGSPQGRLSYSARSSADYATQAQHSMYSEAFLVFCDPHVTEPSSADVDAPLELSLCDTSDSVYEHCVQPFQGIYSEEQVALNSSGGSDAQLSIPIVRAGQEKSKVNCTWSGCSALVNKVSLNRHVREVHERRFKAVCAGCGKKFKRPYQKNEHILQTRCGRS